MFVLLRQLRPPVEAAASDSETTRGSHLAPPWIAGMGEYSGASPTVCGQDFLNRRGGGRVGGTMSVSPSWCLSLSQPVLASQPSCLCVGVSCVPRQRQRNCQTDVTEKKFS